MKNKNRFAVIVQAVIVQAVIGAAACAASLMSSTALAADRLGGFEEDATRPRPSKPAPGNESAKRSGASQSKTQTDDSDWGLGDLFGDIISDVFIAGGINSWRRVAAPPEEQKEHEVTPREDGDALLPYVRVDAAYHWVDHQIHASDVRGEIGYGPVGVEGRESRYVDSAASASLQLRQYHFLYRMCPGSVFEIDLGIGRTELIGMQSNSGSSFTLPLLFHPNSAIGFEYRPSWATINGNTIANHEIALEIGDRFWALRAGYRWLKSPNDQLSGPFAGISARF